MTVFRICFLLNKIFEENVVAYVLKATHQEPLDLLTWHFRPSYNVSNGMAVSISEWQQHIRKVFNVSECCELCLKFLLSQTQKQTHHEKVKLLFTVFSVLRTLLFVKLLNAYCLNFEKSKHKDRLLIILALTFNLLTIHFTWNIFLTHINSIWNISTQTCFLMHQEATRVSESWILQYVNQNPLINNSYSFSNITHLNYVFWSLCHDWERKLITLIYELNLSWWRFILK